MLGLERSHPGAISVSAVFPNLPKEAFELARFWITPERSYVAAGRFERWSPELLGSLIVECVRTAARTYAAGGEMSEAEALQRLWCGFDEERARLGSTESSEDLH
jgi:hypothetical protein